MDARTAERTPDTTAVGVMGLDVPPQRHSLLMSPINRRRWENFKANRRGYWAFWIFLVLFVVTLFAEFLAKLRATPEAGGSLLDNSLYLYGSGMGNPNVHDHTNLPILVAGGAAGRMKGGRHIRFAKATPLANLHLTLLDKVGVRLDKFADSQGKVDELFDPISM